MISYFLQWNFGVRDTLCPSFWIYLGQVFQQLGDLKRSLGLASFKRIKEMSPPCRKKQKFPLTFAFFH